MSQIEGLVAASSAQSAERSPVAWRHWNRRLFHTPHFAAAPKRACHHEIEAAQRQVAALNREASGDAFVINAHTSLRQAASANHVVVCIRSTDRCRVARAKLISGTCRIDSFRRAMAQLCAEAPHAPRTTSNTLIVVNAFQAAKSRLSNTAREGLATCDA